MPANQNSNFQNLKEKLSNVGANSFTIVNAINTVRIVMNKIKELILSSDTTDNDTDRQG